MSMWWRVAMNHSDSRCACGNLPSNVCCTQCQHIYVGETERRAYDDITVGYYSSYELACEAAEAIIKVNPDSEDI